MLSSLVEIWKISHCVFSVSYCQLYNNFFTRVHVSVKPVFHVCNVCDLDTKENTTVLSRYDLNGKKAYLRWLPIVLALLQAF